MLWYSFFKVDKQYFEHTDFFLSYSINLYLLLVKQLPFLSLSSMKIVLVLLCLYTVKAAFTLCNISTILEFLQSDCNSHHYLTYYSSEIVSDLSTFKNCQTCVCFDRRQRFCLVTTVIKTA